MKQQTLGFIGAGNMASSLIGGLVADDYPADQIWVSDTHEDALNTLVERHGVHVSPRNAIVAEYAQILILAVKPQVMRGVVEELAPLIQALAPHRPHRLVSREPSLNEVFLHLYGGTPGANRGNGRAK